MSIQSVSIHTTSTHENHLPQVVYLAVALVRMGIHTTVLGPIGPSSSAELGRNGVEIKQRPISRLSRKLRLALLMRFVAALSDDEPQADLADGRGVHAHEARARQEVAVDALLNLVKGNRTITRDMLVAAVERLKQHLQAARDGCEKAVHGSMGL